jgi:hypothetical protein
MNQYKMSNLGAINKYLDVEFVRLPEDLFLHQKSYVTKVLKEFNMAECRSLKLPVDVGKYLVELNGTPNVDQTFYQKMVG